MTRQKFLAPIFLAAALSACASTVEDYPSLAIRDAERVSGTMQAVETDPPPPPAPIATDLRERLVQLQDQAAASHREFIEAAPVAERLVSGAANAAITTDRWAAAQVALADLDSARSATAIALGDLDLIFVDAALELDQRAEIVTARERVVALVAEEDAILARLRGRLTN